MFFNITTWYHPKWLFQTLPIMTLTWVQDKLLGLTRKCSSKNENKLKTSLQVWLHGINPRHVMKLIKWNARSHKVKSVWESRGSNFQTPKVNSHFRNWNFFKVPNVSKCNLGYWNISKMVWSLDHWKPLNVNYNMVRWAFHF
jgi:hypothetical protein